MNWSPQSNAEEDREFTDLFHEIRRSLQNDQRPEAEWLIYMLERHIRDYLLDYRSQAMAVAVANARAGARMVAERIRKNHCGGRV